LTLRTYILTLIIQEFAKGKVQVELLNSTAVFK